MATRNAKAQTDLVSPAQSGPWSFSKLSTWGCPLRYKFHYLDKLKQDPTPPLMFGSAAHVFGKRYHDRCDAMMSPIETEAIPEILEVIAGEFAHHLSPEQHGDLVDVCTRWARNTIVKPGGESEVDLAMTSDFEGCGYWSKEALFRGKLDRLWTTEDGLHAEITDLKTQWSIPSESDRRMRDQAELYAALVYATYPVESVTVRFDYMRFPRVVEREIDRATAMRAVDRLLGVAGAISAATEFPARPGADCSICSFWSLCPAASDSSGGDKVVTQEDAERVGGMAHLLEMRLQAMKSRLKAWVDQAGPLNCGNVEWNYRPVASRGYTNDDAEAIAKAAGLKPGALLSPDATAIKKAIVSSEAAAQTASVRGFDKTYTRFECKKLEEESAG